jgi:serine/threonine protein kinase
MHIIHRDIKCANVYITEDGDIQLGDFGIVGVMDDPSSKRKTVIGTPHWMAEEMLAAMTSGTTSEGYGTEIDIWSYGCTVWEMATGTPPNSNRHPEEVGDALADVTPRLTGEEYPEVLRDFIAFCLNPDAKGRPTAAELLRHPLIADTSEAYPTSSLVPLIERFKIWELGGGSRASLWIAGPADPRVYHNNDGDTSDNAEEDSFGNWNFSTSDNFDQAFGRRFSQLSSAYHEEQPSSSPHGSGLLPLATKDLSVAERITFTFFTLLSFSCCKMPTSFLKSLIVSSLGS